VLVALPICVSILLLARSLAIVVMLPLPVTAQIAETMLSLQIIASVIRIAVCFIAGIIVHTGPGRRAQLAVERDLLNRIPGYALVRGLAARMSGRHENDMFALPLVKWGDGLLMALVAQLHDDGALAVSVRSGPTPTAGAVYRFEGTRTSHRCGLCQSSVGRLEMGCRRGRPAR
jgi:hypothetical protein